MINEDIITRLRRAEQKYTWLASVQDEAQLKKKWEACAKATTLLGEHAQSTVLANALQVIVGMSLDDVVYHLRRLKFDVGEKAVRKYLRIISNDTNTDYVLRGYRTRLYLTR